MAYTAIATATAGRNGHVESSDGVLNLTTAMPGSGKAGATNPEQLFAAGWSACFQGAMSHAARKMKVVLPPDMAIDAEVDLGLTGDAYFLQARIHVSLPGLERKLAQEIVAAAHQTCPYSKATRGNIDVTIAVV